MIFICNPGGQPFLKVEQVREWLPLNLFDARQSKNLVHLHVENDIHLSPWDAYENLF